MTVDVFRCDYCGSLAPIGPSDIYWEPLEALSNGDQLWLPAVYCSSYCVRTATARAGSGRG